MDEYRGKEVRTRIVATQNEKSWWTVEQYVTERRSKDLVDWEEKEVSASAVADDMENAYNQCMMTIAVYLESVEGSLFNESNLIKGEEKEQ